jgi:hypothetical protein
MTYRSAHGSHMHPHMKTRIKALTDMSRQAIVTRYKGPTDASGSRIVASCEARRMIIPYDHSLDIQGNHAAAALTLFQALGWHERHDLVMGGTKDGYVFVQVPKST